MSEPQYFQQVSQAVRFQDGSSLSNLLSISIPNNLLQERSNFALPQRDEVIDQKWTDLVSTYLSLLKSITKHGDLKKAFETSLDLVSQLNRIASNETNWIIGLLILLSTELKYVGNLYNSNKGDQSTPEHSRAPLEKIADVFNRSFKICLSDKNPDLATSKKIAVYYFAGILFKLYFTMNKFDLASSLQKVLLSTASTLPSLRKVPKSHSTAYLYLNAILNCFHNRFEEAHKNLTSALSTCLKTNTKNMQCIILLLAPLQLLLSRKLPSDKLYNQFPKVKSRYQTIFNSVKVGDLKTFDAEFDRLEEVLLKNNLYVVFLKLRQLPVLTLLRQVHNVRSSHLVKIADMATALNFSLSHEANQNLLSFEEAEQHISILIAIGYVKGYISHGNKVAVLSKTKPFPIS
ncbi:BA75_04541T0 [Komagataella pastoris]|uniref:BA75_04541T0 n=1 Tax=Komagataella pastoris TaxID=4922 RepID=A0A1B2JHQ4_PICPA|nr:BA75_04541T0 [Komagataella pastoris]